MKKKEEKKLTKDQAEKKILLLKNMPSVGTAAKRKCFL